MKTFKWHTYPHNDLICYNFPALTIWLHTRILFITVPGSLAQSQLRTFICWAMKLLRQWRKCFQMNVNFYQWIYKIHLFVQITSRSVFCFLTKEVKWGLKGKTVTRRIKSEKQTMKISNNTKIFRRNLFNVNLFPRTSSWITLLLSRKVNQNMNEGNFSLKNRLFST